MSMTREEAIKTFEDILQLSPTLDDTGCSVTEAMKVALSALRPVSRERVERLWKSEWVDNGERDSNGVPKTFAISCKRCGSSAGTTWMSFCPHCGAPMTDEAVEMVMERMDKCINLT